MSACHNTGNASPPGRHRRELLKWSLAVAAGTAYGLGAPAVLAGDAPVETVKAYLAAWNAHDIDAAAALLAEDVICLDATVGTPVTGRAAVREAIIAAFLNAAPDARWEMTGEAVAHGDRVGFEWRFSGTNTGAWADGTAATGKAFTFTGASMMTVRDGRIAIQNDYYDALGFYRQLGLM